MTTASYVLRRVHPHRGSLGDRTVDSLVPREMPFTLLLRALRFSHPVPCTVLLRPVNQHMQTQKSLGRESLLKQ